MKTKNPDFPGEPPRSSPKNQETVTEYRNSQTTARISTDNLRNFKEDLRNSTEDFRNSTEGLRNSTELPRNSTEDAPNSTKEPNQLQNLSTKDGRKKPRSQKQIESYQKNFAGRHSEKSKKATAIPGKSFLTQEYIRSMSVFDPNQDYRNESNEINPESLYETVMQVQELLHEITSLLQETQEAPYKMRSQDQLAQKDYVASPNHEQSEDQKSPEEENIEEVQYNQDDQETIYDNIF
jgi:hypothetical protein